ncbi:MAG: dihydrodipicolinate synthase family protein [Oscillospiraceae bacterium]|nr:dihydrodipicolinate synthase family protein [Oscillospiraceae bacterium]
MMMKNRLKGVCPILPTPFLEDGSIDVQGIRNEVNFMIKAGVSGIALFGNASEAFALTGREKQLIADTVREENRGRVPLVFGAGGTGIAPAVESCLWAEENGADILMIMPPHMIKPDAKRIYEFYAAIAQTVKTPIMIQDAPNACGVAVPVDIMVQLAKEYETVQYIKAEAPPTFRKAKQIVDAAGDLLTVFGGLNATFFYEELCVGVVGTMPAGEFPDVAVRVYDLFEAGKKAEAKAEFYRYLPFIRLGSIPGGMAMAVHKEVLKRGGIIRTSMVRNPFIPADDALIGLVTDALEGLELLALSGKWNEDGE